MRDEDTKKDFSNLVKEYQFFQAHSTEHRENMSKLLEMLDSFIRNKTEICILDFGGGDGELLFDLYKSIANSRLRLKLALLEPVSDYRESATKKFNEANIELSIFDTVDKMPENFADIIIMCHSIYYVPEIQPVLSTIRACLKENGEAWIVVANENNDLIKLWAYFFELIKMEIPYHTNHDVELVCTKIFSDIQKKYIASNFSCQFETKSIQQLMKFLLSNYLEKIPEIEIQRKMSEFIQQDGCISLVLNDTILQLKK